MGNSSPPPLEGGGGGRGFAVRLFRRDTGTTPSPNPSLKGRERKRHIRPTIGSAPSLWHPPANHRTPCMGGATSDGQQHGTGGVPLRHPHRRFHAVRGRTFLHRGA